MKHATAATLDQLEPLLVHLRMLPGLKEKSRGCFYRKSKSFLHFHEDPAGFFADIDDGSEFIRLPLNSESEKRELIEVARKIIEEKNKGPEVA
jgi:hypothetical protein